MNLTCFLYLWMFWILLADLQLIFLYLIPFYLTSLYLFSFYLISLYLFSFYLTSLYLFFIYLILLYLIPFYLTSLHLIPFYFSLSIYFSPIKPHYFFASNSYLFGSLSMPFLSKKSQMGLKTIARVTSLLVAECQSPQACHMTLLYWSQIRMPLLESLANDGV